MTSENGYKEKLLQIMVSASETYDKNIFTLATIILGSSFTFLEYYRKLQDLALLYLSWILFLLAITASLSTLVYVQYSSIKKIKHSTSGDDFKPLILQGIVGAFFVLALIFLLSFVISNISMCTHNNS